MPISLAGGHFGQCAFEKILLIPFPPPPILPSPLKEEKSMGGTFEL